MGRKLTYARERPMSDKEIDYIGEIFVETTRELAGVYCQKFIKRLREKIPDLENVILSWETNRNKAGVVVGVTVRPLVFNFKDKKGG